MIKVLHLTTHLNVGGITVYIRMLAKEMQRLGYDFSVVSSGGTEAESLEQKGIRCFTFNLKTKSELSPKIYMALPSLIRFVKKEKTDLLHAHTRVTQVLAWWIRFFTGVPYVSTCHGFYKRRLGRRIFPAWGNHVVAISEPVEEDMRKHFHVQKERVSTIFNAIDIEELRARYAEKNPLQIRKELNIPSDSPVVGIVARVVKDKGHEYLLAAADRLIRERFPNLKVLVVGGGNDLDRIKKLARNLGLSQSVFFTGSVRDITYPLAAMDIFVLPACWREGFGLSIIEAMSLSKPVVVTNIWALNALVTDRVTGLLIPPRNPEALANALTELLENGELRSLISEKGNDMVTQEFSISKMAENMDALYRRIIAETARTGQNISA